MPTLSILALDVETTGLDPATDTVVELAAVGARMDLATGRYDALETLFTTLVDPQRTIPATASAVHHLTARDLQGQPDLAQAVTGLQAAVRDFRPQLLVAHNAAFEAAFLPSLAAELTPEDPRWACTYRLAQHLWPDAPGHQLQVLRYWRHLQDRVTGCDAHRAGFDAACCAVLLAEQCRAWTPAGQAVTPALLRDRSAAAPLLRTVPFGRHRGACWRDVPRDYLEWILRTHASDTDNPFDPAIVTTAEAALRGTYAAAPEPDVDAPGHDGG